MALRVLNETHGNGFALYNADCIDLAAQLPSNSVDLALYSPPFGNLYCYSDSDRDAGNCENDAQFMAQYAFFVRELHRIMRPGRLVAVHCKDLVNYANSSGMAGLRDFPGDIIRAHVAAGFAFHSRTTVWRDPVTEMQKTKAHGLLYKQLRKDSSFSRQGMAEYVVVFRKWAKDGDEVRPVTHTRESFPLDQWQQWASPVWMDVDHCDTLNVRIARDDKDEKHLCPLSLDLVRRCICLWSNPGDTVLDPFMGVGSTGVVALESGRNVLGIELKESYFRQAAKNLAAAAGGAKEQVGLFDRPAAE